MTVAHSFTFNETYEFKRERQEPRSETGQVVRAGQVVSLLKRRHIPGVTEYNPLMDNEKIAELDYDPFALRFYVVRVTGSGQNAGVELALCNGDPQHLVVDDVSITRVARAYNLFVMYHELVPVGPTEERLPAPHNETDADDHRALEGYRSDLRAKYRHAVQVAEATDPLYANGLKAKKGDLARHVKRGTEYQVVGFGKTPGSIVIRDLDDRRVKDNVVWSAAYELVSVARPGIVKQRYTCCNCGAQVIETDDLPEGLRVAEYCLACYESGE